MDKRTGVVGSLPTSEDEQPNRGLATVLGVRRSALLEIAVFLGAALAIDYLFFDGIRYRDVAPHPFWLLILLLSVQYGTSEGLLAAALASAAVLVHNLPEQTFTQDRYDYLSDIILTPVLWFAAALILGELRMRQLGERARLRVELSAAEEREEAIATAYKRLSQVKDQLEARIAGQVCSGVTLANAAKAIDKLEPPQVLLGAVDLVRVVMMPEKFSVYLLKNGSLELSTHEGWSANDRFSQVFLPDTVLFQEVIGHQRVLCSPNPEDARVLGDHGLLAGPLINPERGEVLGMLKIEKLGFLDLNFNNVHIFKILCEWIAVAYGNAVRYQTARSESVLSAETRLPSYGFFEQQTGLLTELAERIGFDLSMIIVRLDNADELTEEDVSVIPRALDRVVRTVLRRSDLVFDYQRTGWEFAIVLPGTAIEQTPLICDKLLAGLRQCLNGKASQARFSLAAQAVYREDKAKDKEFTLLPHHFVGQQTQSLIALARRVGFALSVIVLRVVNHENLTDGECRRLPDCMSEAIRTVLHSKEPTFAYQRSYREFTIVLPGASTHEAHGMADRLLLELASQPQEEPRRAHFSSTIEAIHGGQAEVTCV